MNAAQATGNPEASTDSPGLGSIVVLLDDVLKDRGMTQGELARRTGIAVKNLSELKNGKKKAIWWSTLAPICHVLGCQPGDLIRYLPPPAEDTDHTPS